MRLIIFGSTGSIGRQLVSQALHQGHTVTAFARDPEKIKDLQHKNLRLNQGEVLDFGSVQMAMKEHEAVLCALGAGRKGKVRAEGTRNIVVAMENAGIKRMICQTTLGAGDSTGNLNFFWKYVMFGWFLKEAFLDHELQEKYILASNLDWTIVRPAAFTNGNATGHYKHGFDSNHTSLTLKISRADVALFMLRQLSTDEYLRKAPGLSY